MTLRNEGEPELLFLRRSSFFLATSRLSGSLWCFEWCLNGPFSDPTETIQQPWRRVTGTLGVSPLLIPPHSVVKSYTHLASLKYCYISCTFFLYFASVSLMASSRASWRTRCSSDSDSESEAWSRRLFRDGDDSP